MSPIENDNDLTEKKPNQPNKQTQIINRTKYRKLKTP